jgi:hypothetical protein
MSVNDIIEELPHLTFEERQLVISKALELDDPPLSSLDEALIEERLAEYHQDPTSVIDLNELKRRLLSR